MYVCVCASAMYCVRYQGVLYGSWLVVRSTEQSAIAWAVLQEFDLVAQALLVSSRLTKM